MARRYICVGETISYRFHSWASDVDFADVEATIPEPTVRLIPDDDSIVSRVLPLVYDPWTIGLTGQGPGLVTLQLYANVVIDSGDVVTALIVSEILEVEVRPVPEDTSHGTKLTIEELEL
jgi:hypothetical protein